MWVQKQVLQDLLSFCNDFLTVQAEVYNQKKDIKTSNQPAERRDNFEVKRSWKFNLFNFNFI